MLWLLLLSPTGDVRAQADPLAGLPACNFADGADVPALEVGAVVVNLQTGRGCADNLDTPFPVASVPKIFVLGAYLELVMTGQSDYGRQVEFTDRYLMGGSSDCLSDEDLGTRVSRGVLSELMIACSDNAATWMLMDTIGWDTVQRHIDVSGIEGVGEVIPYAEVDRLKLALIDPRWSEVPRQYASRYMRRRETTGLSQYFTTLPEYSRQQMRGAAREYFEVYDYNTATPRAIAEYILKMRADLLANESPRTDVAKAFFNTMMLTQRQFSAQSLPGTVYTGSKNGFDTGLRAEASFTLNTLDNLNRDPESLIIIFARQTEFDAGALQTPGQDEGPINRWLRALSADVAEVLYGETVSVPEIVDDARITTIRMQDSSVVNACYSPYFVSNFDEARVSDFESCLINAGERTGYALDDRAAIGIVLRGVNRQELRVTLVYTRPDGTLRSYQTESFFQNDVGINWFHPVDMRGAWTLDVYINLERVATKRFSVG
jgi:beta-lactamase class A